MAEIQTTPPSPAEIHLAGLRSRVADRYGINHKDAHLFLTQSNEDEMDAFAKALAERYPHLTLPHPTSGNVAPREGSTTHAADHQHNARDFAANLFNTDD